MTEKEFDKYCDDYPNDYKPETGEYEIHEFDYCYLNFEDQINDIQTKRIDEIYYAKTLELAKKIKYYAEYNSWGVTFSENGTIMDWPTFQIYKIINIDEHGKTVLENIDSD